MFFDNASTTRVDDSIIEGISMINNDFYYNPGGLYSSGRASREYIDSCRKLVMKKLGATNASLIFTGSASEANNLALFGAARKNGRILVSMGEHPSIYNTALELKNRGYLVDFIKLGVDGCVDFDDFKAKMTKDVSLVSIMHVSNETGAINDIENLVRFARSVNNDVVFHCDGVQAVGKIGVDIDDLGVDMYTISAHKIHGLKGIGALIVSKNITLKPIVFGGGQEMGFRSGTENIVGIYSLAEAVRIACDNIDENYSNVSALRKSFLDRMVEVGLDYKINSNENGSPYIISISFPGVRAETLLNMLDDNGFSIGNGSACSSKHSGNRILEAMGNGKRIVESNVRISFSKYNNNTEVLMLVDCIGKCVRKYLINI